MPQQNRVAHLMKDIFHLHHVTPPEPATVLPPEVAEADPLYMYFNKSMLLHVLMDNRESLRRSRTLNLTGEQREASALQLERLDAVIRTVRAHAEQMLFGGFFPVADGHTHHD
jgi:hypothetical protein